MASITLKDICKTYEDSGVAAVKDFNMEIKDKEFIIFVGPSGCGKSTTLRMIAGLEEITSGELYIDDELLNDVAPKDRDIAMVFQNYALYPHNRLGTTMIYVTHDQTEAMTLGTRIVVMKDGLVQQIDSPHNLYAYPQNLFVAGFIGSPQMNFFTTTCKANGDQVSLMLGEYEIKLPEVKAKALIEGGYDGKEVTMGIRPEDIHTTDQILAANPSVPMKAEVNVYELLGAEVYLYFNFCGTNVIARTEADTKAGVGDMVEFVMDVDKIHVFDKDTENTICN